MRRYHEGREIGGRIGKKTIQKRYTRRCLVIMDKVKPRLEECVEISTISEYDQ